MSRFWSIFLLKRCIVSNFQVHGFSCTLSSIIGIVSTEIGTGVLGLPEKDAETAQNPGFTGAVRPD
jgi:hypothetical protein